MRIEAYNQVAQLYQNNQPGKSGKAYGTAMGRDEVTISRAGYDYQIAKQAVAEASDVREDKVARLKARVESGTYRVDSDAFAGKLLGKYRTLL